MSKADFTEEEIAAAVAAVIRNLQLNRISAQEAQVEENQVASVSGACIQRCEN
jgi:hypothetical protein